MPRQLRVEFPGAIYHLMSRGDRREDIFLNDVDRHDFLKTLAEACQKTGSQVHAYCLMRNHFHLVAETPEPNLVEGMRWLLSTYTIRLNHRHKLFGHVFSGRYKALLIDGESSGYLRTVCDYVHLNPVRADLLLPDEPVSAYPWSSLHWYAAAAAHRPSWLRVDRLLGEHGLRDDTPQTRAEFLARIESRRAEEDEQALHPIRRGWCLGSPAFQQQMRDLIEAQAKETPGQLRVENSILRAQRIITEELARLGWTAEQLAARRRNDPAKLAIAARLRKETTLTIKEISQRLYLGRVKTAKTNLHRATKHAGRSNPTSLQSQREFVGI